MSKQKLVIISCAIILFIGSIIEIIPPYILRFVVDYGLAQSNYGLIVILCLLSIFIYILASGLNYLSSYLINLASERIIYNIKSDVIRNILFLPLNFFAKNEKGYIVARIGEVNNIKFLISASNIKLISSSIQFIIVSIILFNINFNLTLMLYIFLPIYFLICKYIMKYTRKASIEYMEKSSKNAGKLQEIISGLQTIRIFNTEKLEKNKIDKLNKELVKLSIKQSVVSTTGIEGILIINSILSILILMFSCKNIINGTMTLGVYITYSSLFPRVTVPIQLIATNAITVQPGLIAVKRLEDLFGHFTSTTEEERIELKYTSGTIEVENLSFTYDNDTNVLDNLSLKIKSGDWIEIKGENGSGKTTFIKLITGLYSGYKGKIFIDEIDLEQLDKSSYRSRLGIVSQDVFLFNGTVRDNIFYGAEKDDKKQIHIDEFEYIFNKFPEGLNTIVGENGQLLSGGQKQLVAVARVLLKNPDVLIFDEATSNLDIHIKKLFSSICEKYFRGKTCIFISHDEGFLFKTDRVINLSHKTNTNKERINE